MDDGTRELRDATERVTSERSPATLSEAPREHNIQRGRGILVISYITKRNIVDVMKISK